MFSSKETLIGLRFVRIELSIFVVTLANIRTKNSVVGIEINTRISHDSIDDKSILYLYHLKAQIFGACLYRFWVLIQIRFSTTQPQLHLSFENLKSELHYEIHWNGIAKREHLHSLLLLWNKNEIEIRADFAVFFSSLIRQISKSRISDPSFHKMQTIFLCSYWNLEYKFMDKSSYFIDFLWTYFVLHTKNDLVARCGRAIYGERKNSN